MNNSKPRRKLSEYKINKYSNNFNYFDTYQSKHRLHQIDAIEAASESNKGQIISPCGTGKTRIQTSIHIAEMIRLSKEDECGIFVIASHRLTLNQQLLDQVVDVAIKCGLPFDIVYIGSMRCDFSNYYSKYACLKYTSDVSNHLQSTDIKEISDFINKSRSNFRNVIVASTYDSISTLAKIGKIDIITFDEAHNTVSNEFSENISKIKHNVNKEYYFTATRKIAGEDGGMNNEEFYGKILIDITPNLMLERGEIVSPRLHLIDGDSDQITKSSDTGMLVKNTIEAYVHHKIMVKKHSCQPDSIGAKLLVSCNSIEEMLRIYLDPNIINYSDDIKLLAISSNGCYFNGVSCSKFDFFKHLSGMTDSEDAIIFHVDMLTEGIDLPSITGVMPLRNMSLTKLIQLFGRALRLHKTDRGALYSGEIAADDHKNYIKPFGYLVIPRHLSTINEYSQMIKTAQLFYSEFGIRFEELIIQENFISYESEKLDSMIPLQLKSKNDYDLNHSEMNLIDEINVKILETNLMTVKNSQTIKLFEGLFL